MSIIAEALKKIAKETTKKREESRRGVSRTSRISSEKVEPSDKKRVAEARVERRKKRDYSFYFRIFFTTSTILFFGIAGMLLYYLLSEHAAQIPQIIKQPIEEKIPEGAGDKGATSIIFSKELIIQKKEVVPKLPEKLPPRLLPKLPSKPKVAPKSDIENLLNLEGIMYTPEKPLAIINSEIVSEGDVVEGFEILSIDKRRVFVGNDEEEFVLILKR